MVRFQRTVFTNGPIDSAANTLQMGKSERDSFQSFGSDYIDTKEKYGLYNVSDSKETCARKILQKSEVTNKRLNNYKHPFYPNNEYLMPATTTTHYLHTKGHAGHEKLIPGNQFDRQLINLTGFQNVELARNYHHHKDVKVGNVAELDPYHLICNKKKDTVLKLVKDNVLDDEDNFDFVQETGASKRELNRKRFFQSRRSKNANKINTSSSAEIKYPASNRSITMIDADKNLTLLHGRIIKKDIFNKRQDNILANNIPSDLLRNFDHENVISKGKKEMSQHFYNTGYVSYQDPFKSHMELGGQHFSLTPLITYQRPAHSKRMHLHKPELVVIPEIGTFQHNKEFAKKDMLLSVPISSRPPLYGTNRRTQRKEEAELKNTRNSNFQNYNKPKKAPHLSSKNYDYTQRKKNLKQSLVAMPN